MSGEVVEGVEGERAAVALVRLRPVLEASPADARPRGQDPDAVALATLAVAQGVAADAPLLARLGQLAAIGEVPAEAGVALEAASWAMRGARRGLAVARARTSGQRVTVALLQEATELRAELQPLLEYHLRRAPPEVQRELAAIREGKGYLDLADDLVRLAHLARTHLGALQGDPDFDAADLDRAGALSSRIHQELATDVDAELASAQRLADQAYGHLARTYETLARAARFLLGAEGEARFPPFSTLGRSRRRAARPDAEEPGPG